MRFTRSASGLGEPAQITSTELAGLEFPAGSMGPKIDACVQFVADHQGADLVDDYLLLPPVDPRQAVVPGDIAVLRVCQLGLATWSVSCACVVCACTVNV